MVGSSTKSRPIAAAALGIPKGPVSDADRPGIITVQGRHFISSPKVTQRQDHYLMARLEAAGLEKLRDQISDDGDMTEFAVKLVKAAYENDTLFEILGAILTEVDATGAPIPLVDGKGRSQKWTVEHAEDVANFVANLDEEEDKAKFNEMLNYIMLLFFTTGATSLLASQSSLTEVAIESADTPISSETPEPAGSSPNEPPSSALEALRHAGVLDPTITASGTKSSAP